MTRMLEDQLNEKALALHLQRVVAGFVGSACRSGQFYQATARSALHSHRQRRVVA